MVPVALLVRMSRVCERRHPRVGRNVDLLGEEERQVARERGLHAVGPLVQEDAVAAADDRPRVVQAEREAQRAAPDEPRSDPAARDPSRLPPT